MGFSRLGMFGLLPLTWMLASCPKPAAPETLADSEASTQVTPVEGTTFLSLSDIHFNPYADASLVPTLLASEPAEWRALLDESPKQALSSYGKDPSWPLFRSALEAMKPQEDSQPEFVIISGDFLGHHFDRGFKAAVPKGTNEDYKTFVDKTMAFVALELKRTFGDVPIIPAIGNNDSYCGDYLIEPGGRFLQTVGQQWEPLISPDASVPGFAETFAAGGYYSVAHPTVPNHRMVVLNTVFYSTKYANSCGSDDVDPGADQLAWLTETLEASKAAGEKVWVLYHIPVGVSAYSASKKKSPCGDNTPMSWEAERSDAFLTLFQQHADTIQASFAGHTHMDDFRVLREEDTAEAFVHVTPAISPLFGNNPGFQIFAFDPEQGSVADYTTFFLDLSQADKQWVPEYTWSQAYQQQQYSPEHVNAAREAIGEGGNARNRYIEFYPVGNHKSGQIDANNWEVFWCSAGNMTSEGFTGCYCDE